jgi:tRNA (guanine-N7-)-methyltransferase
VLRFWNNEVLQDLDAVGDRIFAALGEISENQNTPIPTPALPLKGRERDAASRKNPAHRPIRSYVLRQGRMSVAQKRAYDQLLSRYAVPYTPEPLRFAELFGRTASTILEIGFGMGETTAAIAKAHPHNDYLGIEVHSPGVGSLLKLIDEQQLTNVRLIQRDAMDVVEHMIPPDALAGIHVFFPDPWPKTRHQKRRLIQPPFVRLLASRLVPGGYLHMATDWQEYAEQMLEVLAAESSLVNSAAGFAGRPDYRPLTKFEQRGLRLGHSVWDLIFRRRP